ncbi:unnamed protein product [Hydatigera taeniaeformis]|uniref:Peptidase A1 domain-containing protein n=1 Tax=Hydatigena taeniaeformis TaxID=6205 RepID=A0A0R3WIN8_HYDTA|nr:unnamed protein product [Hydatigera taeniaeformis]
MDSSGVLPKTGSKKPRTFAEKQDCPKGNVVVNSVLLKGEMLGAYEASKSLEAEYIRSLHKQIYLFELENHYLRKELGKTGGSDPLLDKRDEDGMKKATTNANAPMTDDQRAELINDLVRKCGEIQEKLAHEIALRKEQMDIFTQDILRLKGEKEMLLKSNQKKDHLIGELKETINTLKNQLVEVEEKFETCKQALTMEVKRRKGLERKIEEKIGNVLTLEMSLPSVDSQLQKKVTFQADELKKIIYNSEEQTLPKYSLSQAQSKLMGEPKRKEGTDIKEDLLSGVTVARRKWFTNEQDFMNGSKPIVRQIGPYTYEQSTCKTALDAVPQNGSVRYSDKNSFLFLPDRSAGLESDEITVLNVGYIAIASNIGKNYLLAKLAKQLIKLFYHSKLFLKKAVFEMIWGYEDPALKVINQFIAVETIIGLYAGKNNSAGPTFEVNDGVEDTTKVGQIITFNGRREMSVWRTSLANRIVGSDGSLFSPFLGSNVNVFSGDVCRSLQFHAAEKPETVYINSVPTTKFCLSKDTFLSPDEYPDNRGFCLDYPDCPKSGTLDMRKCMKGAPIAISLPHFNGADESYRNDVIGMDPREDMDISLYIEPQTGVILQALQMVQINAIIKQNSFFTELAHLKKVTYLPIGYINTSIYVSESVAHTLMSTLIVPQMSISVAASLIITGALVSLVVNSGLLIYHRCHSSQISDGTEENAPLIVECPPDHPSPDDPQASTIDSSLISFENDETLPAVENKIEDI